MSISRCVIGDSGCRGGPPNSRVELRRRHRQALAVVEVRHVHPHGPVVFHVHHLAGDAIDVARLAVRRQPHQLVFARVDAKPAVVGERRIQQAERVREPQFVRQREAIALAVAVGRRRPFADAVERQDRGLLERRRKERARRVRLVMLAVENASLVLAGQLTPQLAIEEQLLLDPHRHRLAERRKAARRERQVGLDQPIELEERLVVEGDVVDRIERQPGLCQAIVDGMRGKPRVMLLAAESFLLGGSDDVAIDDERGGRVVVEGREAENGGHRISIVCVPSAREQRRRPSGISCPVVSCQFKTALSAD